MLNVVTFKWKSAPGYRSHHTAEHVNIMRNMVERCYPHPHTFTCVTDDGADIDRRVRILKLWDDFKDMKSPHGGNNPACYRRLKLWSDWASKKIGPRILQIDLDMVLTDDVSPLWNRPEPCVMWADNLNPTTPYNGAMQLFSPAEFPRVWRGFHPVHSPIAAKKLGYWGSDQAYLCMALGPDQARWRASDGAVSWRVHCKSNLNRLPEGARVVNFHGAQDPWGLRENVPWIAENYR